MCFSTGLNSNSTKEIQMKKLATTLAINVMAVLFVPFIVYDVLSAKVRQTAKKLELRF